MSHEELSDLRELARTIFADAAERQATTVERPLDPQLWSTLAETGFTRLTGSADAGGSEAGWAEAAVVLGEAAAAGVPLPLLEHDLLAGWLRDTAGLSAPDAGDGAGGASGADAAPVFATAATVTRAGAPVSVPWARAASSIVVVDQSGGESRAYEIAAADVEIEERDGVSGEPRDIVTFPAPPAGSVALDPAVADEWRLRGALGRAVQIAGAAESITDLSIAHVTTRVQFGRPIGKFQAVQQLVTDVACEAAMDRTIVDVAVNSAVERGFADEATRFHIAAAKATTGGSVSTLVRNSHQLHGAIGTTLEHQLQRRTRPLTQWNREFGSAAEWERNLEQLVTDEGRGLWELITQ